MFIIKEKCLIKTFTRKKNLWKKNIIKERAYQIILKT